MRKALSIDYILESICQHQHNAGQQRAPQMMEALIQGRVSSTEIPRSVEMTSASPYTNQAPEPLHAKIYDWEDAMLNILIQADLQSIRIHLSCLGVL